MITIPAVSSRVQDEGGEAVTLQSPEAPIPADAIAVVCDGKTYTIYQTGDMPPDM